MVVALANSPSCEKKRLEKSDTDAFIARNESGPSRQESMTNALRGAHGPPGEPTVPGPEPNNAQVSKLPKGKGGADAFGSRA